MEINNEKTTQVDDGTKAPLEILLKPLSLDEFLSLDLPARELIISPWLPVKGLAMLFAPRGIGKTFFALTCAHAAATGSEFLGFAASKPRRVIYIDGEMPASTLQARLTNIARAFGKESLLPGYFRILASDLHEDFPDLATPEGQTKINAAIGDAELIIVDNLSTLVRSGRENEADSWIPIQDWVLGHRRAGRSVLMVHHAGKNGSARGTSKREDVLDTIISLRRPQDYSSADGARFEVHFEKARGFYGEPAEAFEAQYSELDGVASWERKSITDVEMNKVIDATKEGMSVREVAEATGIKKSKVSRLQNAARAQGMLPPLE